MDVRRGILWETMRNPPEHKVRIYFLNGETSRRRNFVARLREILEYRTALLSRRKEIGG